MTANSLALILTKDFDQMMNQNDLLYKIAFTQLNGIGPIRARRILKILDNPADFFTMKIKELHQLTSIPLAQLERTDRNSALLRAQTQLPYFDNADLSYHFITDPTYPIKLRHCPDAPIGLFYRGNSPFWNSSRLIAIVGSRQQTDYGKNIVAEFISNLPENIVIVSGLARGIDATAHQICLDQNRMTMGVLGHGIDKIYPAQNRTLAQQLLANGGLISEFLVGTKPDKMNFPMRNRIIAGLSDAVVVIESKKNGGSLITAQLANDYNREVFAFPGQVFNSESAGCHQLIQNQQAHLITNTQEFIDQMDWTNKSQIAKAENYPYKNTTQQHIIKSFQCRSTWTIDELVIAIKLPVAEVSVNLFELELSGVLENLGGNRYRLPL
jgi:DNA processing protein